MFKEIKNQADFSSVTAKDKELLLEFVTKGISPKDEFTN